MCYSTAKNQHMVWRSPVNYSQELFYVKVGLRNLKIRREVLLRAIEAGDKVGKIFALGEKVNGRSNPLVDSGMDARSLQSYGLGKLRIDPNRKNDKHDPIYEEKLAATSSERAFLETGLTLGELWALPFFLSAKGEKLEQEASA
jgi:CRISPR type IV-associated protein Csf1